MKKEESYEILPLSNRLGSEECVGCNGELVGRNGELVGCDGERSFHWPASLMSGFFDGTGVSALQHFFAQNCASGLLAIVSQYLTPSRSHGNVIPSSTNEEP